MAVVDDPKSTQYRDRDREAAKGERRKEYLEHMKSLPDPLRAFSDSDREKFENRWKPKAVWRAYEPDENGRVEVLFIDKDDEPCTAYFFGPTGKKFSHMEVGW